MLSRPRVLAPLLAVALALTLAACGGDDESQPAAAATEPPATTQATTPTATVPTTTVPTTTTPAATVPPATTTTPTTPSSGGAPARTTPEDPGGAAAPTTTPAPSGGAASDCAEAVGGFIRDVRASGTDCGVATQVAGAWFDAIDAGQAPDAPIEAAGFACGGSLSGQVASITCRGDGTVTFTASP